MTAPARLAAGTPANSTDLLNAVKALAQNDPGYKKACDYYAGTVSEVFASTRLRRAMRATGIGFVFNFARLPVDARSERIQISAVTAKPDSANAKLDDLWTANKLNLVGRQIQRRALELGDAYAMCWPSPDDESQIDICYNSPRSVRVFYDQERPLKKSFAVKQWTVDDNTVRADLYYPDRIEKYQRIGKGQQAVWVQYTDDPGDQWPYENPFGEIPFFHFRTDDPYGEPAHKGFYGPQDAIHKLIISHMAGVDYQAFPQRYALVHPDSDTSEPAAADEDEFAFANPTGATSPDSEGRSQFQADPGSVWFMQGIQGVGQFQTADPQNFTDPMLTYLRFGAQITNTPLHRIDPTGEQPSGEALALDTRIPTPDGIRLMGDLREGDRVFDEKGEIQTVTHAFRVMHGRPCYRVTFDDGTQIVADAEHKWLTSVGTRRKHGGVTTYSAEQAVRTTEKIAPRGIRKHSIPVTQPLNTPEADLPIDPYTLGAWLGDGCSHHFTIIQHEDDAEELAANIRQSGQFARVRPIAGRPTVRMITMTPGMEEGLCRRGHDRPNGTKCTVCEAAGYRHRRYGEPMPQSFKETMRGLGMYRNKHIPEQYFRASHKQRLALLQGIMDTDGCPKKAQGSVEIALSDERLAHDVHRLIQSLGHKVALRSRDSKSQGCVVGTEWRMTWSAPEPVFRLSRKLAHQRTDWEGSGQHGRGTRRYVQSVEPVESVPVRCIEVSGPSHLYLATDAHIATHNSLRTAEAPFVKACQDLMESFEDTWVELLTFALKAAGVTATDIDVQWKPAQSVDDVEGWQTVRAKLDAGLPVRQAFLEAGYSAEQVEEWFGEEADDLGFAVDLLVKIGAALASLGSAVSLGAVSDAQVQALIAAIIGDDDGDGVADIMDPDEAGPGAQEMADRIAAAKKAAAPPPPVLPPAQDQPLIPDGAGDPAAA